VSRKKGYCKQWNTLLNNKKLILPFARNHDIASDAYYDIAQSFILQRARVNLYRLVFAKVTATA